MKEWSYRCLGNSAWNCHHSQMKGQLIWDVPTKYLHPKKGWQLFSQIFRTELQDLALLAFWRRCFLVHAFLLEQRLPERPAAEMAILRPSLKAEIQMWILVMKFCTYPPVNSCKIIPKKSSGFWKTMGYFHNVSYTVLGFWGFWS